MNPGGISSDYVRLITKMIYDEPCVMGAIAMLQVAAFAVEFNKATVLLLQAIPAA